MNGRRAKHDAAHPIAAACFLGASFVVLGITLGVVIVDWGWSWLTTVLGALAVALAVLTAVCLIPETEDDDDAADWPDAMASMNDRCPGCAAIECPGDCDEADLDEARQVEHDAMVAELDQGERGDSR